MPILSAAEYCRRRNYPLYRFKKHCKEGRIPAEITGSWYHVDTDKADPALDAILESGKAKKQVKEKTKGPVIETVEQMRAALRGI